MLCAECYKEIPACEVYYKEQDTDQCFCSTDCLLDHQIYSHMVTLETSTGEESKLNEDESYDD